jgi:hypothetical protein
LRGATIFAVMTAKLRLLLVSAGTVVGQKVLATLDGRRDGIELIGTSSVANEPALFDLDRIHLVPATLKDPGRFEQRLLEIVERERPDLVIPCRDDDVEFLAGLRDRRPDLAARLLCGNHATARVARDKWLSHQFCIERGLPFVPSIVGGHDDRAAFLRTHGFPLVSKPRRGFSAQGIHLLFNERQFERALGDEDLVVQVFLGDASRLADYLAEVDSRGVPLFHSLQGLKHSIQALVGPDGDVARVICTRNLRAERRAKWVEADADPATAAMGRHIAEAFAAEGWRGPLNIQCQRASKGHLLVHEFNGRFTGATSDRWMLGFDEVGTTIELFTGFRFAGETARNASREVFESMVARAADPKHVDALARDGVWSKAAS